MPSFRDRLFALAMDGKGAPLHSMFQDAASICANKTAAMTYGYLLGKEDANKEEPGIYQQLCALLGQMNEGELEVVDAADLCFGLIYKWLDKMYEDEDYDPPTDNYAGARFYLAEAFRPLVRPGVIPLAKQDKDE